MRDVICRSQTHGENTLGSSGSNKQDATKHMRRDEHIYSEPLTDEHINTNAAGHATGHTSTHLHTQTTQAE